MSASVATASGELSIAQAAGAVGISVHTLRWYEQQDLLLVPAERNGAGHRRYGEADMSWLRGLMMLRATGISIAQMREYARACRPQTCDPQRRLAILEDHQRQVREDLARTRTVSARV